MGFQVLVKTAQHMLGSYSYLLEDEEQAKLFVRRPDVWWYHFSAAAGDGDWDWHKGGAWAAATARPADLDLMPEVPLPEQVTTGDVTDDEDDRW